MEAAREWRDRLVETVAENDDDIMVMYLEGEEPAVDELKAAIRRGTLDGKFTPILTGTAFKNKGVQPMLDAVVDYLPSPLDVEAVEGHKPGDESVVDRAQARGRRAAVRAGVQDHRPTRTWAS